MLLPALYTRHWTAQVTSTCATIDFWWSNHAGVTAWRPLSASAPLCHLSIHWSNVKSHETPGDCLRAVHSKAPGSYPTLTNYQHSRNCIQKAQEHCLLQNLRFLKSWGRFPDLSEVFGSTPFTAEACSNRLFCHQVCQLASILGCWSLGLSSLFLMQTNVSYLIYLPCRHACTNIQPCAQLWYRLYIRIYVYTHICHSIRLLSAKRQNHSLVLELFSGQHGQGLGSCQRKTNGAYLFWHPKFSCLKKSQLTGPET